MFLQKRMIRGIEYKYIEHSFRVGDKVQKVSFILDKNREDYNEEIINRIAAARAAHFIKNSKAYFLAGEVAEIEAEKIFYQIFYNSLDAKGKQEILDEFVRLFLANSMELEGSTITPQLAENIDRKKNIVLPESEVKLYQNSKKALFSLMNTSFRSVVQFKRLHQGIYQGILADAGNFKKFPNTFGYTDKAQTIAPEEVRGELQKIFEYYKDKNIYLFLRPLRFHLEYQRVHPFRDGNSRLGRILLVTQMFKLNYPPFIFKGDMSFQIRETLIEYINNGHFDFYRLCYGQYMQTARKFWRPMIRKYWS